MAFLKANIVIVMATILLIFSSVAAAMFSNGPILSNPILAKRRVLSVPNGPVDPNPSTGRRVLSVSEQLPDHQSDSHKSTGSGEQTPYGPVPPFHCLHPPYCPGFLPHPKP